MSLVLDADAQAGYACARVSTGAESVIRLKIVRCRYNRLRSTYNALMG